MQKAKEAKAENLVTIVAVTEIDRELLDSFLSTVVGGEKPAAGLPQSELVLAPAAVHAVPQPLMQLVDFGKNFGSQLMPSMNALVNQGMNLRTYISRIDAIAGRPYNRRLQGLRDAT
jgi:hypothetical protein